jgi:hypothetical protein
MPDAGPERAGAWVGAVADQLLGPVIGRPIEAD